MRVCQRCGDEFRADRCESCGYTAFVVVDDPPAAPEPPVADPEAVETPPAPLSKAGRQTLWRSGSALGLLLLPPLLERLSKVIVDRVPETAAGCGPLVLTGIAVVAAAVAQYTRLPLAVGAIAVAIAAVISGARWYRESRDDDTEPDA